MSEGFNVIEPMEIDVQDVKEQRSVLPARKDVKLRIKKAELRERRVQSEEKGGTGADNPVVTRSLNLSLSLVDGYEDGKYKGFPLFQDVMYWADLNVKKGDWYGNKQHLVQLRFLLSALGLPMKTTIGDQFIQEITGRELLGSIRTRKVQVFDPSTGKYVDTDDLRNEVGGYKASI